jgi:hypothetical protein
MFLDVLRWIASSSHTSFAVLGIQRFAQLKVENSERARRRNRRIAGETGASPGK